jgi:YHS domain-containing protein
MGLMSTSWLLIAIAVGVAIYLFRRRSSATSGRQTTDFRNLLGGPRQGGHDGRAGDGVQPASGSSGDAPEAAIDPVSGEPLATARALTSLHQGRVYYFANRENRERFEASPEKYAGKVAGHAVPGSDAQHEQQHRHGC